MTPSVPLLSVRLLSILLVALTTHRSVVCGAEFFVSSAAEIAATLPGVQPGDSLVMTNGNWTDQNIQLAAFGTATQPITLRAETPGRVILNGRSRLSISGDWLVADGLRFEGGALPGGDHVVEFRGSLGAATNSRLTNSAIIDYNPDNINTRYFWVSLYGQNNRVDNNFFQGQSHSGVTVVVWRDSDAPDFHRIDRNHFADRPVGNGNGFESVRIGTSTHSLSDSFTTVENNLFDNVDGEIEIISNKSGSNSFRYNTFRRSSGTLTLRHGDNNQVDGNFFLGEGKSGTGGVRVIGERQTLINNYFAGLDGRADGAISISAGVPDSQVNEYFQVKDALVAHNTVVDVNGAAITFDHGLGSSGRTLLAEHVTIANNLLRSTVDPLLEGMEGAGWTWEGNIAYGQSLGPAVGNPGISVVDPQLMLESSGLWRPAGTSPAVNGGAGDYSSLVVDDMDGQPRISALDVGADEFSSAAIVRKPLLGGDVGPAWRTPGVGDCLTQGIAVQAEDYAAVLDPNGDTVVWVTVESVDSLGGQTLRAPIGPLVDRPADSHDSIAVYDVQFDQAGSYTAYYRARGFDSTSDSIYVPADFEVDPEITEMLSSDGTYRWDTGGTFEITPAEVGVPLEFRIGRREHLADFDAFVLHLNTSLSAAQLDALFQLDCSVDFNADGLVDCHDVNALVAEIVDGTHLAAFDLTGDGLVDQDDLSDWLAHAGVINLASGSAYLPGDANLDGDVDTSDFNLWNGNKFTHTAAWCHGDFNADGMVDASDFNIWNGHKFQSANSQVVPEPAAVGLLCVAWIAMVGWTRLAMKGNAVKGSRGRNES